MPHTTFALQTANGLLPDIQIWNDGAAAQPALDSNIEVVTTVNHTRIPLFLVSCGPFDVYSGHAETESYFFNTLAYLDASAGILARFTLDNPVTYVVFFLDHRSLPRIRCYYIDFSVCEQVSEFRQRASDAGDTDVFFVSRTLGSTVRPDTSVFDRVLDHKTSRKASHILAPQPTVAVSLALTSSQQISETVSRVVLSGLRLRGLSVNPQTSVNEKITIREIYQMTNRAANFALRKYSYEFNDRGRSAQGASEITLAEIQSIVESLLLTFVDVETASFDRNEPAQSMHACEEPDINSKGF